MKRRWRINQRLKPDAAESGGAMAPNLNALGGVQSCGQPLAGGIRRQWDVLDWLNMAVDSSNLPRWDTEEGLVQEVREDSSEERSEIGNWPRQEHRSRQQELRMGIMGQSWTVWLTNPMPEMHISNTESLNTSHMYFFSPLHFLFSHLPALNPTCTGTISVQHVKPVRRNSLALVFSHSLSAPPDGTHPCAQSLHSDVCIELRDMPLPKATPRPALPSLCLTGHRQKANSRIVDGVMEWKMNSSASGKLKGSDFLYSSPPFSVRTLDAGGS